MIARVGAAFFGAALLFPLVGLAVPVGAWRWGGSAVLDAARVSIGLTALAMLVVVVLGTPMAYYVAGAGAFERRFWQAVLLVSILVPPLGLGILISLAFGAHGVGNALARVGLVAANTPFAFVLTQVYVGIGYYALGSIAALDAVPTSLQVQARLLGASPLAVFRRVTFPLARLGFAVALSLAWVRALTEFGAVVVTAYYPAGLPVAIWTNLENFGLPAVMPLLVVFLAVSLPLPWLAHVLAQRRTLRA